MVDDSDLQDERYEIEWNTLEVVTGPLRKGKYTAVRIDWAIGDNNRVMFGYTPGRVIVKDGKETFYSYKYILHQFLPEYITLLRTAAGIVATTNADELVSRSSDAPSQSAIRAILNDKLSNG